MGPSTTGQGRLRRETGLELVWEVSGDPITDDWTPDEIDAIGLLDPMRSPAQC